MEDVDPILLHVAGLCLFTYAHWGAMIEEAAKDFGHEAAETAAHCHKEELRRLQLLYRRDTDAELCFRALQLDLSPIMRKALERLAAEACL